MKQIIVMCAIMVLAGCAPTPQCSSPPKATAVAPAVIAPVPKPTAAPEFKAEQVVMLSKNAFGCQYLGTMIEAAIHQAKGEYSAMYAGLRKEGGCFSDADASAKWTVYQVRDDQSVQFVQIGHASVAQYDAATNDTRIDASAQYWVLARFLSPVVNKSN